MYFTPVCPACMHILLRYCPFKCLHFSRKAPSVAFRLVTVSSGQIYILSPSTVCIGLVSHHKWFLNKVSTSNFRATRNARGSCLSFEVADIFLNAWSSWMASWLYPYTFLLIEKS